MIDDAELLRRYAEEERQDAFAEIVGRHIDVVYGVAVRQTHGNTALAEDVTQMVCSRGRPSLRAPPVDQLFLL